MRTRPLLQLVATLGLAPLAAAQTLGTELSVGPFGGNFLQAEIDPADPGRLLVSSYDQGLLLSTNGGASFGTIGAGLPAPSFSAYVRALEPDRDGPGRFLAGVASQLFESTDGGLTWSPTGFVADGDIRHLSVSPDGQSWLLASGSTLYLSTDDGVTWSSVFSASIQSRPVWSTTEGGVAWVGTFDGAFRSVDGGQSFANPGADTTWAKAVLPDPLTPGVVYLGGCCGTLKRSTDGGVTWSNLAAPTNSSVQFLAADPSAPGRIWLGFLASIHFSNNGGQSWVNASAGLPPTQPILTDLAITPGGDRFLSTEGGGIFRALATDNAWTQVGVPVVELWDVAIAEPGGQRIYTNFKGTWVGDGPFQFVTPGAWNFDFGAHTNDLLVDPNDPGRWILGGVGAFIDNATIRVLTNQGATVQTPVEIFGAGQVVDLAQDPLQPTRLVGCLFPAGFGAPGLIVSDDTGASWAPVPGTVGLPFTDAGIDPFQPGRWLATNPTPGGSGTLYRSVDGGQSLQAVGPLPGSGLPVLLAFDPLRPGFVYHADDADGLWRSADGGATWKLVLAGTGDRRDLEFHPTNPGTFWYSTSAGDLLLTGDGGDSFVVAWSTPLGNPLDGLAFDPATDSLVVATENESGYEVLGANPYTLLGGSSAPSGGADATLIGEGGLPGLGNAGFGLALEGAPAGALCVLHLGLSDLDLPLFGGVLHTGFPTVVQLTGPAGPDGRFAAPLPVPSNPPLAGLQLFTQGFVVDPAAVGGIALSGGVGLRLLP